VTIRDLTHVVVRAEELREGDIILHHDLGLVLIVTPCVGGEVAGVTCEGGEWFYDADALVSVYRVTSPGAEFANYGGAMGDYQ